jgi:hypothetical protein
LLDSGVGISSTPSKTKATANNHTSRHLSGFFYGENTMPGSPSEYVVVALFLLNGIFAVIWFLLRKKDDAQEKHICDQDVRINELSVKLDQQVALLFEKHDRDVERLVDFKLKIAEEHYLKPELDTKFEKLELSFRDGFKDMGLKFDNLANALLKNIG